MHSNHVKTKSILLVGTMLLSPAIFLPGKAVAQARPASRAPDSPPAVTAAPAASTEGRKAIPPVRTVDDQKAADPKEGDPKEAGEAVADEPQPARLTPDRRKADTAADGAIVVTGSRIGGYDPTSDVKVYTQD